MTARIIGHSHNRQETIIDAPTDIYPCRKQCQNLSIKHARRAALSKSQTPRLFNLANSCGKRSGKHDEICEINSSGNDLPQTTFLRLDEFSKDTPEADGGGLGCALDVPSTSRASLAALVFNRLMKKDKPSKDKS
jgi:hypothetical protein